MELDRLCLSQETDRKFKGKYPGEFDPAAVPTAYELLAKLTMAGLAVKFSSLRVEDHLLWYCETVWKGELARGKVFYSGWHRYLAEALAEVFDSWKDFERELQETPTAMERETIL